jgi:CubicO group peptidase (beta-lactamase class C family)
MKSRPHIFIFSLFILSSALFIQPLNAQYFPDKNFAWERKSASEVNMNQSALNDAVKFALENEYSGAKDLRRAILKGFEREPFHEILGPTKKRGGPAGVIIKDGYIISAWGDLNRVDMTFSVTKSYLSTIAGLAVDAMLIKNVTDPVGEYVWDGTFDGAHNKKINWHHLLTQSSDWSGSLWGGKDWADRPPREGGLNDWEFRELNEPGTVFEYNDVRVNVLAYSLLHVWRKPLPMILKEKVMDKIGASSTWRWFGYDHAWTNIDGIKMQSVSGGGHSGGGVFINTLDHARFGLLFLNDGNWNGEQLISKSWIDKAMMSSEANESYGYMWWLNRGGRKWKNIDDPNIFYAAGFGGNYIVVDQSKGLVVVTRWLEPNTLGTFMELVYQSLEEN